MKAFLEKTNLFSHKISFKYYRKQAYHSFIGISLSIVMYILMIYFIIYFSGDFIYRKNPRLTFKETEFNEELKINLSSLIDEIYFNLSLATNNTSVKNYFLSKNASVNEFIQLQISFSDEKNDLVDENKTIYNTNSDINLTFNELLFNVNDKNNFTNFIFDNHKIIYERVINKDSKFLLKQNIRKSNQDNEVLSSQVMNLRDQKFSDLQIPITKTSKIDFRILLNDQIFLMHTKTKANTISNSNSSSFNTKEDITNTQNIFVYEKKFDDLKYSIDLFKRRFIYFNNIINVDSDDFFKETKINNSYTSKKIEIDKTVSCRNFLYEVIENFNDKEIIFSNKIGNWKFHRKSSFTNNLYLETNKPIVFLKLRFDEVKKNYDRVYKKIQNIFADLSGIFSTFILFGNLIINWFNHTKFHYDAVNHIFTKEEGNSASSNFDDNDHKIINNGSDRCGIIKNNNNFGFIKKEFDLENRNRKSRESSPGSLFRFSEGTNRILKANENKLQNSNYNYYFNKRIKILNSVQENSNEIVNHLLINKNGNDFVAKYYENANPNISNNNNDSKITSPFIKEKKQEKNICEKYLLKNELQFKNKINENNIQLQQKKKEILLNSKSANDDDNPDSSRSFNLPINNEFDSSSEIPKNKNTLILYQNNNKQNYTSSKRNVKTSTKNFSSILDDKKNSISALDFNLSKKDTKDYFDFKENVDLEIKDLSSARLFEIYKTNNNKNKIEKNLINIKNSNNSDNDFSNSLERIEILKKEEKIDSNQNLLDKKENSINLILQKHQKDSNLSEKLNAAATDNKNNKNDNIQILKNKKNLNQKSINFIKTYAITESNNKAKNKLESFLKQKISKLSKTNNKSKSTKPSKMIFNAERLLKFEKADFFRLFLCCVKLKSKEFLEKEKMFKSAEQKINEYLDILNFFHLHEDLEKLKIVLFNEFQLNAFDFSRKRTYNEINLRNNDQKLFKTIKYFRANKGKYDYLDKKLSGLFCKEFFELVNLE